MTRGDPTQHQQNFWASYIGATTIVNIGGAAIANATVLAPGHYVAYCRETGLYLRQGAADVAVDNTCFLLAAGEYVDFTVDDNLNGFVKALTADGLAGTLRLTQVSGTTGDPTTHQNDYWASYFGVTQAVAFTSGAAVRTTLLTPGHYLLYSRDGATYLRQGGSTVVADGNQFLLERETYRDLTVDDASTGYLSIRGVDGSGTLRITRIDTEA